MKVSDATLLRMWGKIVKLKAGNKCEYPGCTVNATQLHPHHYYNKKNQSVRYDPLNGICLCHIHHTNGNEAAHLDPDFKEKWLSSGKRPEGWLQKLTDRKNQIVKNNQFYRENWKINLKVILEMLNSNKRIDYNNLPF
ncbi:MAG: hypothetical protein ABFD75_12145 [Smithella sp.]